jgi:hypothetical protein
MPPFAHPASLHGAVTVHYRLRSCGVGTTVLLVALFSLFTHLKYIVAKTKTAPLKIEGLLRAFKQVLLLRLSDQSLQITAF